MVVAVQFPFSDARRFVSEETNRLLVPRWPLANAGSEFVRSFGQVRRRLRGGVENWSGEELYCVADRALHFDPPLSRQRLDTAAASLKATCIFRRFFSDGVVVSRLESAFWFEAPSGTPALEGQHCLKLIESCYALRTRVPSTNGPPQNCELLDSARFLAALYLAANTRRIGGKPAQTEPYWFVARDPLLLIQYGDSEIASLPKFSSAAMDMPEAGLQLHQCWVNRRGRMLSVWFLRVQPGANADVLRRLRIHLFRLHAERECLKEVLNLIAQKKITIVPKSDSSNELQDYLLESTRLLSSQTYYGFKQSELLQAVQGFDSIVNPGDRPTLLSQLSMIRKNILTNIAEFTTPGKDTAGSVHMIGGTIVYAQVAKIGGDTMTSYNVTISGSNNTVGDIVVAEKIQNSFNKAEASRVSEEQKKNLATLHQQIIELSKQLPSDQARQVASDLESFTNEITSPTPRRKWYELSASGLIDAAKTVATMAAPIATTVTAILGVMGLAAAV